VFDEDLHINAVNGESILITNHPDLQRESSASVLGGVEWKPAVGIGQALFEVNVFHTRIRNLFFVGDVDDEDTPVREFQRLNLGAARVAGVEVNVGWGIGSRLVLQAGLVRQQAGYDNAEPTFGSQAFHRTPRSSAVGLASWSPRQLALLVAARYTGRMVVPHYAGYIAEDRLERTPRFLELDASVARAISPRTKVIVTGKNLTNALQRDFDQGPLRDSGYIYGPRFPRAIGIALRTEF
jgi:outer membrane receptor for ferrienterochelin and colicins